MRSCYRLESGIWSGNQKKDGRSAIDISFEKRGPEDCGGGIARVDVSAKCREGVHIDGVRSSKKLISMKSLPSDDYRVSSKEP